MKSSLPFLLMTALLAGVAAPVALAADASSEADARRRFQRGQKLYEEGRFTEAAEEFTVGYKAVPRPLFLLNIGHSYRAAEDLVRARRAYQQLMRVDPSTPYRAEVEELIRGLDESLAPRPTPQKQPSTPPGLVLSAAQAPWEQPSLGAKPLVRKPWFWSVVGTAVLLGATGLVLTMTAGTRSTCPVDLCIMEVRVP